MKLLPKILALFVSIILLFGTTGFTLMEHQCIHCGTDYSVLFLDNNDLPESLCSIQEEDDCCSDNTGEEEKGPSLFEDEECCTFSYQKQIISDPAEKTLVNFAFSYLLSSPVYNSIDYALYDDIVNVRYSDLIKPGGRLIVIQNSCFLA